MNWREQARENVLAVARMRGETLTERQIQRRVRNRLAWRAIGTVALGAGKLVGGAIGSVTGAVGDAVAKVRE